MAVLVSGAGIVAHFFFQAEDGIRALYVTGVQACALPISFYSYTHGMATRNQKAFWHARRVPSIREDLSGTDVLLSFRDLEIGRASCRERDQNSVSADYLDIWIRDLEKKWYVHMGRTRLRS